MMRTYITNPFKGVEEKTTYIKKWIKKYPKNCWVDLDLSIDSIRAQSETEAMLIMARDEARETMEARVDEEISRCEDYLAQLESLRGQNGVEEAGLLDEIIEFLNYMLNESEKLNVARERGRWEEKRESGPIDAMWRFAASKLRSYRYVLENIPMMPLHMLDFDEIRPVFEAYWDEVKDSPDLEGRRYYINTSTMEVMEMTNE